MSTVILYEQGMKEVIKCYQSLNTWNANLCLIIYLYLNIHIHNNIFFEFITDQSPTYAHDAAL